MNGREMIEEVFGEATTQQAMLRLTPQEEKKIAQLVASAPIETLLKNVGIEMGRHVADVLGVAGVRPAALAQNEEIYKHLAKRLIQHLASEQTPVREGYIEQVRSRG